MLRYHTFKGMFAEMKLEAFLKTNSNAKPTCLARAHNPNTNDLELTMIYEDGYEDIDVTHPREQEATQA